MTVCVPAPLPPGPGPASKPGKRAHRAKRHPPLTDLPSIDGRLASARSVSNERVRLVYLWLHVHAELLEDRDKRLAEAAERVF